MRPVKGGKPQPYSRNRVLMVLKNEFEQREIKKTPNSMRQWIPLHTPSGMQCTESNLEAELVQQIAFIPSVYDIITQAIMPYERAGKMRRYTADVICSFAINEGMLPSRFVLEAKREDDLAKKADEYRDRFNAADEMAAAMGAVFRVLTEKEIKTPYLTNTKRFARLTGEDPDFNALDALKIAFGESLFSFTDAEAKLIEAGSEPWLAKESVERLIAWRCIRSDLMHEIMDESMLEIPGQHDLRKFTDPFLALLQSPNNHDSRWNK